VDAMCCKNLLDTLNISWPVVVSKLNIILLYSHYQQNVQHLTPLAQCTKYSYFESPRSAHILAPLQFRNSLGD